MLLPIIMASALAQLAASAPMDLTVLDTAIERCERDTVLPLFAAEPHRRSAFITTSYQEQAAINAERLVIADKRRSIREGARADMPATSPAAAKPAESDQELALAQLALDDRQRALDDRRRLETLRQEAVDLKRLYFLGRCPSGKKKND